MHTEDIITFSNESPSFDKVLIKIRELSGLREINVKEVNGIFKIFVHPLFNELYSFLMIREKNRYRFMRGWNNRSYLLEITISALVEFGGMYEGELKAWSDKRWDEVADQFPEPILPQGMED